VIVVHTLEEAFAEAQKENPIEIHIGGGAQLYEQALPFVDELKVTIIDDTKEADTFFPPYEKEFTKKTLDEAHEYEGIKYRWVNLSRA
jgi:dihydrofolate reductase